MTKVGYKSVTIPISLFGVLQEKARRDKTSIGRVIEKGVLGESSPKLLTLCSARSSGVQVPLSSPFINAGFSGNGACGETKDVNKVPAVQYHTKTFEMFLKVQKNLSAGTVEKHITLANVFLEHSKGAIDAKSVQNFMLLIKNEKSQKTYSNYLCTLKVLLRDYLKKPELIVDFKFPTIGFKPKILPSKLQLETFFEALPSLKYQIIFLALASSGLRVSELLNAKIDNANRMLIPKTHNGTTKNAWVSFYNEETEKLLKAYQANPFENSRNTVTHVFKKTANKTSINITPQTLRSVFAREMSKAGVQDRYIDCFSGRTPQSVLARHYSDYSPEVLKEIYSMANIKILE